MGVERKLLINGCFAAFVLANWKCEWTVKVLDATVLDNELDHLLSLSTPLDGLEYLYAPAFHPGGRMRDPRLDLILDPDLYYPLLHPDASPFEYCPRVRPPFMLQPGSKLRRRYPRSLERPRHGIYFHRYSRDWHQPIPMEYEEATLADIASVMGPHPAFANNSGSRSGKTK